MRKLIEGVKRWTHDKLHWGYPIEWRVLEKGKSESSTCKFCEGRLLKDSTGAWFHIKNHDNIR